MSESSIPGDASSRLETVKELYAAFGRGDIGAILVLLAADVEWSEPAHPFNPAGGTRHGHAGFLEWVRIGQAAEQILALEPRQFLYNDTSVAVVGHSECLAKATGRRYETDFVHLITFRNGRIARFQEFFDTYTAGEAFRS
jgi:ketosteroid isomerase-like protein